MQLRCWDREVASQLWVERGRAGQSRVSTEPHPPPRPPAGVVCIPTKGHMAGRHRRGSRERGDWGGVQSAAAGASVGALGQSRGQITKLHGSGEGVGCCPQKLEGR